MKLISWNCQWAFRKKINPILANKPDILIIQECESIEKLRLDFLGIYPTDIFWIWDNVNKWIWIFSFWDYKFSILSEYNHGIKYVLPISVTSFESQFILFAVWANNREDKDNQYIEQIWKAISYYESILSNENIILIWDFNSNKIWDKKHRVWNHSDVVDKLSEKNIHSIYHKFLDQKQGEESHPTFFLQRNKNKPYHIDYCFASWNFYSKVKDFSIWNYDEWIGISDHVPVQVEFSL